MLQVAQAPEDVRDLVGASFKDSRHRGRDGLLAAWAAGILLTSGCGEDPAKPKEPDIPVREVRVLAGQVIVRAKHFPNEGQFRLDVNTTHVGVPDGQRLSASYYVTDPVNRAYVGHVCAKWEGAPLGVGLCGAGGEEVRNVSSVSLWIHDTNLPSSLKVDGRILVAVDSVGIIYHFVTTVPVGSS